MFNSSLISRDLGATQLSISYYRARRSSRQCPYHVRCPASTENDAPESERLVHLISHASPQLLYTSIVVLQPSSLDRPQLSNLLCYSPPPNPLLFCFMSHTVAVIFPDSRENFSHTQYTYTCKADAPASALKTHNNALGKKNGRSRLERSRQDLRSLIDRSKTGQLQQV